MRLAVVPFCVPNPANGALEPKTDGNHNPRVGGFEFLPGYPRSPAHSWVSAFWTGAGQPGVTKMPTAIMLSHDDIPFEAEQLDLD